jgi:hypothetical protein
VFVEEFELPVLTPFGCWFAVEQLLSLKRPGWKSRHPEWAMLEEG